MFNLFRAEQYRLRHGKELPICTLIILVIGTLNVFLHGDSKIGLLSFMSEIIGLISCSLFAGLYLGYDFSKKTILYSVTSGNCRIAVLFSKYFTYLLACIIILICNVLVIDGLYIVMFGAGQMFTSTKISVILCYSAAGILYDLCIVSIPFLITMLLKDTGTSIVVSVIVMGSILASSEIFWVDRTFPILIVAENLSLPFSTIIMSLIIPIVTFCVSGVSFHKTDIK